MIRIILILILIIVSFISVFVGVKDISIFDIHRLNQDELLVMLVSRLPRMISVLIAGVGMSISGLIVQQISMNK
ncbi:MAG: iron chelate uptake ABC transporter family permease subunit, partial [Flavobacteriaceae bacterium]|nr:iron chelate uptake ABC transporter family permease subunit [Flavobacteriaceae bacterium]